MCCRNDDTGIMRTEGSRQLVRVQRRQGTMQASAHIG
jgi:hypothetical protein